MFTLFMWTLCFKCVIGRLTVVHETSVSDILIIDGRLSAFQNFDHVDQCTAECSLESQCVSLAFSPATGSCQLYKYDVANFTVDVITQKQTIFFKVVCERHDYTYIRSLNVCMKMYHDERTSDESRDTCKEDGADLLRIDTSAKMAYLKPVLAHISNEDYGYYLGGYAVEGSNEYQWYGIDTGVDVPIDKDNGGELWGHHGAPVCIHTGGCCLSLQSHNGSTPLFAREDCTTQLMFICAKELF